MSEPDRSSLPIRRPAFAGVTNKTLDGSQPDWNLIGHPTPPDGALIYATFRARVLLPLCSCSPAYRFAPGWDVLNRVGCGGERPQDTFATKIEALNHVFVQDGEHYGGFDAEYLRNTLAKAGFDDIEQVDWRTGRFPGGAIDREQHASYSLYMEARR